MRVAHLAAAVVLVGLLTGLLGAVGSARADAPPDADEPPVERWSADPRLWLALIEWRQRLRLELASSRELCTAGTLTEVSWEIAGGKPPYKLQVEGTPVNAEADNIRINCGALSEAEVADEAADLAAKRVTAVVTDARGVRREAALDVARARALPAPTGLNSAPQGSTALFWWEEVSGAGSQSPLFYRYSGAPPQHRRYLLRHQPIGAATWIYEFTNNNAITLGLPDGERLVSVAAIRHPLEADAPGALAWSAPIDYANVTSPTNVTVTATHDTITVAWDVQRHVPEGYVALLGPNGSVTRGFQSPEDAARASVRFNHLTPATNFTVRLKIGWFESNIGQITVQTATKSAPPGYRSLSASPQRLQLTATHDSITVAWEPPYNGAEPLYYITISEELTGRPVARRVVHDGATTWTEYGSFTSIQPATTYHVVVRHGGIRGGEAEATITTSTRPTGARASSGSSSADRTLHLQWPVRLDSDYAYRDDSAEWRAGDTDNRGVTARAETTVLRYNAYDAAGEVASAGSYAFLTAAASVVATYEGLRDGTAKRLLIHKSDAQGVSRATLYDAVATGDFFEWRETGDCWVRYRVSEVLPDPAGGAPRKLLAVDWTTYAFSGCSGAIAADAAVAFDWGPLPDLGGPSLAAPIRHGPFQIVPEGWEGPVEEDPFRPWPGNSYANPVATADLAEARRLPRWRDPTLPAGWTLLLASSGDPSSDPPYGYCAG